jgi:hypothetical protein
LNDKNAGVAVVAPKEDTAQLSLQIPSATISVPSGKESLPVTTPTIAVMTSVGTAPIQDFTKPSSTDWIAVGSFILAILSFIVTAWIVWSAMKQQITTFLKTINSQEKISADVKEREYKKVRADILSRNRQDWINSLRNELSELISSAHSLVDSHALLSALTPSGADAVAERKQILSKISLERGVLYRHKTKIELLLNPTEQDSIKIVKKIDELTSKAVDLNVMHIEPIAESIVELGQTILKTEWNRVKLLEGYDQ